MIPKSEKLLYNKKLNTSKLFTKGKLKNMINSFIRATGIFLFISINLMIGIGEALHQQSIVGFIPKK